MEHAKHIIRAVLLLVVIAVAFVFVRHFSIPETFGEEGHYRASSVDEIRAQSPRHGDRGACLDCHGDEAEAVSEGEHATVSCEVCHGPLRRHVTESGEKIADMPIRRSYELCAGCHEQLVARPKDFPQVLIPDHVTDQGAELGDEGCLECHNAHDPLE